MTFSFPKQARLLHRGQFRRLGRSGRVVEGRYVTVKWRGHSWPVTRLGITVRKKFGKAHERNRFKRVVREAFRLLLPELAQGVDLLVYPRSAAKHVSSCTMIQELRAVLPDALWKDE